MWRNGQINSITALFQCFMRIFLQLFEKTSWNIITLRADYTTHLLTRTVTIRNHKFWINDSISVVCLFELSIFSSTFINSILFRPYLGKREIFQDGLSLAQAALPSSKKLVYKTKMTTTDTPAFLLSRDDDSLTIGVKNSEKEKLDSVVKMQRLGFFNRVFSCIFL